MKLMSISKKTLFLLVIKPIIDSILFLQFFFIVLWITVGLLNGTEVSVIFGCILLSLLFCIIFLFLFILPSIKGLFRIHKQELELGIKFDDDLKNIKMKRDTIIETNWFIAINGIELFAFNRNYINKIQNERPLGHFSYRATLECIQGVQFKLFDSYHRVLPKLRRWMIHSTKKD